ncbi:hypothetical protein CDIK_3993, partial [Cucumispora dikerogammari]
ACDTEGDLVNCRGSNSAKTITWATKRTSNEIGGHNYDTTLLLNVRGKIVTLRLFYTTIFKNKVIHSTFYEISSRKPRPDYAKSLPNPPNKAGSIYDLGFKRK